MVMYERASKKSENDFRPQSFACHALKLPLISGHATFPCRVCHPAARPLPPRRHHLFRNHCGREKKVSTMSWVNSWNLRGGNTKYVMRFLCENDKKALQCWSIRHLMRKNLSPLYDSIPAALPHLSDFQYAPAVNIWEFHRRAFMRTGKKAMENMTGKLSSLLCMRRKTRKACRLSYRSKEQVIDWSDSGAPWMHVLFVSAKVLCLLTRLFMTFT